MAQVKAAPQKQTPTSDAQTKTHCHAESCKAAEARFGFCDKHFEEFKFGLIKKNGAKVPDYDKKFDHYQAYLKGTQGVTRQVKKAA